MCFPRGLRCNANSSEPTTDRVVETISARSKTHTKAHLNSKCASSPLKCCKGQGVSDIEQAQLCGGHLLPNRPRQLAQKLLLYLNVPSRLAAACDEIAAVCASQTAAHRAGGCIKGALTLSLMSCGILIFGSLSVSKWPFAAPSRVNPKCSPQLTAHLAAARSYQSLF